MQRRTFLNYALSTLAATAYLPSAFSAQPRPSAKSLLAKRLQPGMTVGVIAPLSAPFERSEVRIALDIVDRWASKPNLEKIFSNAEAIWLEEMSKE